MANIDTSNDRSGKRNKPQRRVLRVDFTPMVDMNMLLITFFMFCTTLSIPQVMDVAMPAKGASEPVPESKSITMILGAENKVYYYEGLPNYEDYSSLKEVNFSDMRAKLLERNFSNMDKIKELKQKKYKKEISEKDFKAQMSNIKDSKEGMIVLIKPTKESNFRNLVDALDEMQICGVGKYAILDMDKADNFLLDNFKEKGKLTAMAH